MPTVIPFRGILYNQQRVPLAGVVAPPYDVISPQQQAELYDRHPHNVVRLILGREEDRYEAAAQAFERWLNSGILVREQQPVIYVLHQQFLDLHGQAVVRKGFIALCRLEEFEKKIVLPHEKTLTGPREDRLRLFKATNANFSQVFALYSDPQHRIDPLLTAGTRRPPVAGVEFDGVLNRLWRLVDRENVHAIQLFLREKQVLIADGHHRYETALSYRDWMRSQNPGHTGNELYDYVMMFFTNLDDEGLVIFPTHRVLHSLPDFQPEDVLRRLEQWFTIQSLPTDAELEAALTSATTASFGMRIAGRSELILLSLKPELRPADVVSDDLPAEVKNLDVTLLHTAVFRDILGISVEAQEQKMNLRYVQGLASAFEQVQNGSAQLAFILNPTRIEQVRAVAKAGQTMPQKSTFFYPKLLSGLVLNSLTS